MNWDRSAIDFLNFSKVPPDQQKVDTFLPLCVGALRKITSAYTSLQIVFEDSYSARIKNASPVFLNDFALEPGTVKAFLKVENFDVVYWKRIPQQNNLFADILLALSSAVIIPIKIEDDYRLIILGWIGPQAFEDDFISFVKVIKHRVEEVIRQSMTITTLQNTASKLSAVLEVIPNAVVLIDNEGKEGWVNGKAAELLQLPRPGNQLPAVLAQAMAQLRNNAINREEINAAAEKFFTSPNALIKDWLWKFNDTTIRVSCYPVNEEEVKGKLWMFEEES